MAEVSMSWIQKLTPHIDSPIFCETFAKIRMEKFEKLKKKPMFCWRSKILPFLPKWTHLIKLVCEPNLYNFQSNGHRALVFVSAPPFFAKLNSCLALSDSSENQLPKIWPLGVPKWVQKGVKWVTLSNFQSNSRKMVIFFLPHHFSPS